MKIGFLSDNKYNNIVYIINSKDKMTLLKRMYDMQSYIIKNSPIDLSHCHEAYMFINKTNNNKINMKEYGKAYKQFILEELVLLNPILLICADGNFDFLCSLIRDKKNEKLTKNLRYTPILDMSPLDMSVASRKEYLLYFYYRLDKMFEFERW